MRPRPGRPTAFRLGERTVANDGDLDGAKLEAVEARLRSLARLGRMGQGGSGGGECSGPDGGRAGTQEHPTVEHEHVCSPLLVGSIGRAHRAETEIATSTLLRIAFEYGQIA